MNSTATAAAAGLAVGVGAMGCRPLFTASQWQELEHQALIFKYMMAGIPVPPDLLLPIRQSFDSMAAPRMMSYPHPTLGYCSFYGKKLDPEPGRCRRTDGKKWRCSKEAYPDSKYCERHMHRGRNRSRKPVESQALSQSHQQKSTSPSSSTVTSLNPTATNGTVGNNRGGAVGSFHSGGSSSSSSSIPLNSSIAGVHNRVSSEATNLTQLHMDSGSYSGIGNKEFRYIPGLKSEVDTSSYFCGGVENARGLGINSSLDNSWGHMPSRISAFPLSKDRNGSLLSSGYSQLDSLQDIGQESLSLLSKLQQQPQHCFFGSDYVSSEIPKQGSQSLRPFFDEWPKTRNSWSELEDEQSNRSSFSTTHLSISIPMASSDFSTTGSRSPNGTKSEL